MVGVNLLIIFYFLTCLRIVYSCVAQTIVDVKKNDRFFFSRSLIVKL